MEVNIYNILILIIAYESINCSECPPKKIKFTVNSFDAPVEDHFEEEIISPKRNAISITINGNISTLCKGMLNVTKPTYHFYGEGRGIREIEAGTFENQNFQAQIGLSNNLLVVIRTGTFKNVYIRQLILTNNQITTIEAGAIQDMPNLDVLNLARNKIKEFYPNSLINTPSMLLFDASYNELEKLEAEHFSFMTKDKEVMILIPSNRLRFIHPTAFEKLNILNFNVSDNKLESIPKEIFTNRLIYLGLAYNKLTHLDDEFFKINTGTLRNVELEGNNFDEETAKRLKPFMAIFEENRRRDKEHHHFWILNFFPLLPRV